MQRTAILVFYSLLALPSFAAGTQRYLIATTVPMHQGGMTAAVNRASSPVALRNVVQFETIGAFAADLTAAEADALRHSEGVRIVEPVVERHAFDVARALGAQTLPRGIAMVRAPEAWSARNVTDVNVVVVDTGVDYRHPELRSAWRGGFDFVNKDDDPIDDNGHGTHVSGTILARNNAQGVVGVAPGMRLWGLKVLSSTGSGNNEDVIKALEWVLAKKATEKGLWVVNLSLGSPDKSDVEREAFAKIAAAGVIVVAAAGNSSTSVVPAPVQYPAAYPDVVAVGAVSETRKVATFSCQGPELDHVAPGMAVLSTVRTGTAEIAYFASGSALQQASPVQGSGKGEITAEYVYCGLGKVGEITPQKVRGKIALIKRGEIPFAEKAKRAKENGAAGVIIFNHDASSTYWTMLSDTDPDSHTYQWPVTLALTKAAGEALLEKGSAPVTIACLADDYGEKTGTSMAAPHVTGAAAFLWSIAPTATSSAVLNALSVTAVDLGAPGPDPAYGMGLIDLEAAARFLAPGQFAPPPPPPGGPTTGRRALKR